MRNKRLLRFGRAVLWVVMIAWTAIGLWKGLHGTGELLALKTRGKFVNAQVIGQEPMPAGERMGYVHYAFNEGTRAIDNRMPVPVMAYGQFTIGAAIPVTYLPEDPGVVRIGAVDGARVGRSAMAAAIFLIAGLLAFGLPLIAISATLNPAKSNA